jgi:hypothetical protein
MLEVNFRLVTKNENGDVITYPHTRAGYYEFEDDKQIKHFLKKVFNANGEIFQSTPEVRVMAYLNEDDAKNETNALDTEYKIKIDELRHLGNSKANALLVVVPTAPRDSSEGSKRQKMEAMKPKWRKEEENVCALSQGTLYFVNREQAVKDLYQAHETVFFGSNYRTRPDMWKIALADNELGIGKTEFGKNYIRRCREEWPGGDFTPMGLKESLCACRTIIVTVGQKVFVNAQWLSQKNHTLVWLEMAKVLNKLLAQAVIDQLDLSDVAHLPSYLTSPSDSTSDLVRAIVKELGPIFIVLDEIGQGFEFNTEEQSRDLFIQFCKDVLSGWMQTRHVYFLLVGYAPFLRNVGERKDYEAHSSSPFIFIRPRLHLIQDRADHASYTSCCEQE